MQKIMRIAALIAASTFIFACGDDGGSENSINNGQNTNNHIGDGLRAWQIEFEDVHLYGAHFSPDGTRLAVTYEPDEADDPQIAIMDIDGTNVEVVSEGWSYLTAPIWSNDGESLLINDGAIHKHDLASGEEEELFSIFGFPAAPDLSPDGTHLVYGTNGGTMEIKDLESEDPAVDLGESGYTPSFSPDGTQIAFATGSAIRIMDSDGQNVRDIFTDDENMSYLSSLAWLPDGERLVFTSNLGIELVDVDSGEREVIDDGFATMDIDVSADGKYLIYTVNGDPTLTILENFDPES